MFKKLLTNLPFNPSLLGQVNFYTQRLRNEAFVRGAGLTTLLLALIIQTFAVISPPQHSLAKSPNDIVYGGFTTKNQMVQYCLHPETEPHQDVAKILEYYGVGCDNIASASTTTITIRSNAADYHSLGRNDVSNPSPRNHKNWTIYQVKIPGVSEALWMKDLQYWDSGAYSSYKVLRVTNKDGKVIYIMYDCGNIVTVGKYTPPPPPPAPKPTPTPTKPTPKPTTPVPPKPVPVTDVCTKVPGVQTSKDQCDVCPNIPLEQSSPNECYPCPAAQTDTEATACLTFTKTGSNQTRGIANANNTKAQAGDVISYQLTVKNTGKVEFKDFVFDENLADVLEYADVSDFGGGVLTTNNHLVWPKRTVPANDSIKVQFAVKVKTPIPNTPQSASDPGSYDLCMVNVFYGQTVTVCVQPPVNKQIEVVATSLPNTGPGTSLAVTFGIVALVGYFFARNRLMVEELVIVRDEFSGGGVA